MKVKKLIKTLKQFDKNDDVQIYILENGGDLVHANVESILNTEQQLLQGYFMYLHQNKILLANIGISP